MKISILLPTRNRLSLLRLALESIRRQDYDNWEVVVSDNQSTEPVGKYILALNDNRIRYVRSDVFLPVTDSWNLALQHMHGDYCVMLGDDDALLPGALRTLNAVATRHGQPEAIYVEAVQFAYPDVFPNHPTPFVQTGYSDLFGGELTPFVLDSDARRGAVLKSMSMRYSFGFNMQHWVLSRVLVDRIAASGPVYQSPYPDYYASTVVMLEARDIVAVPRAMVAIGISPKSFGFYYLNDRAEEGSKFLGSFASAYVPADVGAAVLPGNPVLSGWYLAMAWVERNLGRRHHLRADSDRYRFLQLCYALQLNGFRVVRDYWPKLTVTERLRFGSRLAFVKLRARIGPRASSERFVASWFQRLSPWPAFDAHVTPVEHQTVLDLFEATPAITPESLGINVPTGGGGQTDSRARQGRRSLSCLQGPRE